MVGVRKIPEMNFFTVVDILCHVPGKVPNILLVVNEPTCRSLDHSGSETFTSMYL